MHYHLLKRKNTFQTSDTNILCHLDIHKYQILVTLLQPCRPQIKLQSPQILSTIQYEEILELTVLPAVGTVYELLQS